MEVNIVVPRENLSFESFTKEKKPNDLPRLL